MENYLIIEEARKAKMVEFYKTLKSDIDIPSFADANHRSFRDLNPLPNSMSSFTSQ